MRLLADKNVHADIVETMKRETEILSSTNSVIVVLSESGYRIHRPAI